METTPKRYKLLMDFKFYPYMNWFSEYLDGNYKRGDIIDISHNRVAPLVADMIKLNPDIFKPISEELCEACGKNAVRYDVYGIKLCQKCSGNEPKMDCHCSDIDGHDDDCEKKGVRDIEKLRNALYYQIMAINELIDELKDKQRQIDDLKESIRVLENKGNTSFGH